MKTRTNLNNFLVMLVFLLATLCTGASGRIIYVDASAPGPTYDGTSWADAFNYLQDALTAAVSSDEIWVAEGTYKADQDAANPGGTGNRDATFELKNGVAIYGGFAGDESNLYERDWTTNETILSGDLAGDDVGFSNNDENSYHVLISSGTDVTSVLDGFIISGGNADYWPITSPPNPRSSGGGLYNTYGSPRVTHCTFTSNSAAYKGGGMSSFPHSSPTVAHCTFFDNTATTDAGALCIESDGHAVVTHCSFSGNSADSWGGAIFINNSSPTFTNCTFSANSASYNGGAMVIWWQSSPTITNCTFSGNTANNNGGGLFSYTPLGTTTVANSIFWSNTALSGPQIHGSEDVTYCDVQGGYSGTGNISADPMFADACLRLSAGSPCIDVGNNAAVPPSVTTDLDGNPRIVNGVVDMGAYEYGQLNEPPVADVGGPYLVAVGTPCPFDGSCSYDPDNDMLTYEWDCGDGGTATGMTPTHTYSDPGVYDICLTVSDGVATDTQCTYGIVYDPRAGFVTGGGWIYSDAGNYRPDPSLEGKANFGFVSKYKKGANEPTGQTEFVFKAGDLNFHSNSYDWLVVTGSDYARFKGSGTINGEGDYRFMLWAGDGEPDTFRIRIWEEDETSGVEIDIYDNGFDQEIGGGSIVVHVK